MSSFRKFYADDDAMKPEDTINGFPIAPVEAPGPVAPAKTDILKTIQEMRTHGKGLEDFDVAGAQKSRTLSDGANDVGDALYSAFSGAPLQKARGGDPVADMKERSAADKEARRQAIIREENDPASETSRGTAAIVKARFGRLYEELGPMADRIPHAKWVQLLPIVREFAKKADALPKPEKPVDPLDTQIKEKKVGLLDAQIKKALRPPEDHSARDAQKRDDKASDRDEELVKDLEKRIPDGASGFYGQRDVIHQILDRSPKKDIPGVGFVDGKLPVAFSSPDGLELQKNARQMMLAYQNLVTGTGGGQKEMENIARAGADLNNEASFMSGLKALEEGYEARLTKVFAGFPTRTVDTYLSRAPSFKNKKAGTGQNLFNGKPYAKKEHNMARGQTRYLDAAGNVLGVSDGIK